MVNLSGLIILTPGGLGFVFFFILIPLTILISGIFVVVNAVNLARIKREGGVLAYSKRKLIISIVIFVISLAVLLLPILFP